jgi:hypothetical protein
MDPLLMPLIPCGFAALAVACIFYTWRAYTDALLRRQRMLRQRVTWMLWVAANRSGGRRRQPRWKGPIGAIRFDGPGFLA